MGMREHPCAGHVVPVAELYARFPGLESLVREWEAVALDPEDIERWLRERWDSQWPDLLSVFALGDEDTPGEGLEPDVLYVLLDDDQMYERVPTPALRQLRKDGISPRFAIWSIWG